MAPKKKTAAKKAAPKGLHYDKEALFQEYENTFPIIVKSFAVIVGFGLLYFFAMAVYLGGWGHTPHEEQVKQFGDRMDYDYEGLKLPIHGGKTIEEQKAEKGVEGH